MHAKSLKYLSAMAGCLLFAQILSAPAHAIDLETALWHYKRNDFVPAFLDFQILAAEGNTTAMAYMGRMYRQGYAVQKNLVEAEKWYRAAAEGGVPMAHHRLGWMYARGEVGEGRDMVQAAKHWQAAASAGETAAQLDLGVMYWRGDAGLQKDLVKAYAWLTLSSEDPINEAARSNLNRLVEFMSEEEIIQGKNLAQQLGNDIEQKS